MHAVFPFFKPVATCCTKKGDAVEHEEPLLNEPHDHKKHISNHKKVDAGAAVSEEEKKDDPYLILGFGMIAYRDLLFTMIIIFSILTVVMMPAFFFFQKYDGIRPAAQKSYVKYSLGNMGYSTAQCSLIPLGAGDYEDSFQVPLECPFGTFGTAYSFGVNKQSLLPNNYCNVTTEGGNHECSSFVDASYVNQ